MACWVAMDWTEEVQLVFSISHLDVPVDTDASRPAAAAAALAGRSLCVTDQPESPVSTCVSSPGEVLDELPSGTRQRSCRTRACDQLAARSYRRAIGGSPAPVCTRVFATRIGCESSLVPIGPYDVQRSRTVTSQRRVVPGRQLRSARALRRSVHPRWCGSGRTELAVACNYGRLRLSTGAASGVGLVTEQAPTRGP
jgi:hypothetical protein